MAIPEKRKLERVRYWQGQLLKSRDFLDIEAAEGQHRWWHNRALHNAYGVADGLVCSLVPSTASPTVSVSPGLAYDVFGHELILEKAVSVPVPSFISPGLVEVFYLVVRYQPVSGSLARDRDSEVCWTSGCVAAGTVEFVVKPSDGFKVSDGVVVCALNYRNGGLAGQIPFAPVATQPLSRPLLASGTTIPGNTPWEPWAPTYFFDDAEDALLPLVIGVQTWIDTSAAGFTQVPCYFASLQGPLWNPQTQQLLPAIFPSIAEESLTGFYFRLWLRVVAPSFNRIVGVELLSLAAVSSARKGLVTDAPTFLVFAQQQELYVSWIGCQMLGSLSSCCQQPAGSVGPALSRKS